MNRQVKRANGSHGAQTSVDKRCLAQGTNDHVAHQRQIPARPKTIIHYIDKPVIGPGPARMNQLRSDMKARTLETLAEPDRRLRSATEMAMRSLVAGAGKRFDRAAVRAAEPAVLSKAPMIGAPIRAPHPPLLTTAPAMAAPCRAGQTAVLPRAQAMGLPLRAAETPVLTRSPAMGVPLRAAEPWASKAPGMGASIRAGLNTKVGISFAANAAASTRVSAGRVLTPRSAARVWAARAAVKKLFGARCLSTATKPPPTDIGIWDYVLVAVAIGGVAIIYYLTKIEHVDDFHEGELPESIDWSLAIYFPFVAHPFYNTNCGSCWAITGVKSIEAYIAIKEGFPFPNLSIQQAIDCCAINGCDGCSLERFYTYSATTGLTTEEVYPGPAHPGTTPGRGRSFVQGLIKRYCNMEGKPIVVRIQGYERIRPTEEALMIALQRGPVAVSITTSNAFDKYNNTSGILDLRQCPPSSKPNHAVLVVGYGTTKEGVKYWKIMNTWGRWWGNRGYCLFRRTGAGGGVAGITMRSGYRPVLRALIGS